MSGFTLRIPSKASGLNSSQSEFARSCELGMAAVRRGIFSAVNLPPLFETDIKLEDLGDLRSISIRPELALFRPEANCISQHDKIIRLLSKLNPEHALILNGSNILGSSEITRLSVQLLQELIDWRSEHLPKLKFWGEFNFNHPDLKNLDSKVAAGLSGFTTPPPFLRKRFEEALLEFHNSNDNRIDSVSVAVPYITDKNNLLFWLSKFQLDPAEHTELQVTLGLFDRAQRDGCLEKFRSQWNQAQLEYCASMVGLDGLTFMPVSAFGEALQVFEKAVSVTTVPVNSEFIHGSRLVRAKMIQAARQLPVSVNADPEAILFSEHKLPGGKSSYAQQCLPLLDGIVEALKISQLADLDNPVWQKLRLKVQRPTMKIAKPGVSISGFYSDSASYLSSKAPKHFEISINLLPLVKNTPESIVNSILEYLKAFCEGKKSPDQRVRLLNHGDSSKICGDAQSPLLELGMQGYGFLEESAESELITEKGAKLRTGSGGLFPSAERKMFLNLCADQIESALMSSDLDQPVYLEPGCYKAHGIKPLFNELKNRASANEVLMKKLRNLTFLFSDFNADALKTCSDQLGEIDEPTGIRCKYLVLDSTKSPKDAYLEFAGRMIGGRAVNVFDAFASNYIAAIDGNYYQVAATTFINLNSLKNVLHAEWADHHTEHQKDFKFIDNQVDIERIVSILNSNLGNQRVKSIISYLTDELDIPRHRALFLWRKIYETCLEQDHDYIHTSIDTYPWGQDSDGKSMNSMLTEVFSRHSGNFIIPDSLGAICAIDGIINALNSGASFTTIQLVAGINENRSAYHRSRLYGFTSATPINSDILESWANNSGIKFERFLGAKFELNNTNSALVFTKP